MNKKQKNVLWIGIAIIVLIGIFPPGLGWQQTINNPLTIFEVRGEFISYGKLLIQWAIVAVITGGLIYAFKDKQPENEQKQ